MMVWSSTEIKQGYNVKKRTCTKFWLGYQIQRCQQCYFAFHLSLTMRLAKDRAWVPTFIHSNGWEGLTIGEPIFCTQSACINIGLSALHSVWCISWVEHLPSKTKFIAEFGGEGLLISKLRAPSSCPVELMREMDTKMCWSLPWRWNLNSDLPWRPLGRC